MATKTISGTYQDGYNLDPQYSQLNIAEYAKVTGSGVTASAAAKINNLGVVTGAANGITLNQGGSVTNGPAVASYDAHITGNIAIQVDGGTGLVRNSGIIDSSVQTTDVMQPPANGYFYRTVTRQTDTTIDLNQGGTVVNNSGATISNGVSVSGGRGSLTNNGSIGQSTTYNGFVKNNQNSTFYTGTYAKGAAVDFDSGGSVMNGSKTNSNASINGISIAGTSGRVRNYGKINAGASYGISSNSSYPGSTHQIRKNSYEHDRGPSVDFEAGGSVVNTGAAAVISTGISISGGRGRIVNDGRIGGTRVDTYYGGYTETTQYTSFNYDFGFSVDLESGGTVTNRATGNIANGIQIAGGTGTIRNLGMIGSPSYHDPAVVLKAGGRLTNGSASITGASITGTVLQTAGAAATISNFGTIDATDFFGSTHGLDLRANATVTNGSATDTTAKIIGDVGIQVAIGSVTITNFGTIQGTSGTAISFGASTQKLIEEGSGVIRGNVLAHGGTLELGAAGGAGTLSGLGSQFQDVANLVVDKGGNWTLTDTNLFRPTSLATTVTLTNNGALTNNGQLSLAGQTVNRGTFTNQSGAALFLEGNASITPNGSTKTGTFTNAGYIKKTDGGTSVIDSGNGVLTDTGTILVADGTLELTGRLVQVSGDIGGDTIQFGPGSTTLQSGASLSTGTVLISGNGAQVTVATNLSYSGTFTATAGTELSIGNSAYVLSLSGAASFTSALIDGTGQLQTSAATTLAKATIGNRASWANSGTVTETGSLTLSTTRTNGFTNAAGGTFNLAGSVGITATTTTQFVNAGLLAKTSGALSVLSIAIANSGTIEAGSGTLDLKGAVTGTGSLKIDAGKTLQIDGSVASGQTVDFGQHNDTLKLTNATQFAGRLGDFGAGDKLDLTQFASAGTSLTYTANAQNTGGTLNVKNGSLTANIALTGQYTTAGFSQASDGNGGDLITYAPPAAAAATHSVMAHDSFAIALFEAASMTSGTSEPSGTSSFGKPTLTLAADPLGATPAHA